MTWGGFDDEENLIYGKTNKEKTKLKTQTTNKETEKEWADLLHSTQDKSRE